MKVMVMVKATPSSEAGEMPSSKLLEEMTAYNEELAEREERMRSEVESYRLDPPRWEIGPERVIAGLDGEFHSETRDQIPDLWQRFSEKKPFLPAVGADTYGVCHGSDGRNFRYLAGVEVKAGAPLPEGVDSLVLSAQRYAIFPHHGPATELSRTFEAIFSKWLPNSGHKAAQAPSFERYTEEFDPQTMSGGTEVWVPIQE